MSIEQEDPAAYHLRKANQAWELAGCARVDGDKKDEQRHLLDAAQHRAYRIEIRDTGACSCAGHNVVYTKADCRNCSGCRRCHIDTRHPSFLES